MIDLHKKIYIYHSIDWIIPKENRIRIMFLNLWTLIRGLRCDCGTTVSTLHTLSGAAAFSDAAPSKADSRKWRALEKPEYMILQRWMDAAREKLDTPGKIRRGCRGVLKRLFGEVWLVARRELVFWTIGYHFEIWRFRKSFR